MTMKTASVAELKSHLSQYLGFVSQGETVMVTSHRHPVACLVHPPSRAGDLQIVKPERPTSDLDALSPVKLSRAVDGVSELLRDRDRA